MGDVHPIDSDVCDGGKHDLAADYHIDNGVGAEVVVHDPHGGRSALDMTMVSTAASTRAHTGQPLHEGSGCQRPEARSPLADMLRVGRLTPSCDRRSPRRGLNPAGNFWDSPTTVRPAGANTTRSMVGQPIARRGGFEPQMPGCSRHPALFREKTGTPPGPVTQDAHAPSCPIGTGSLRLPLRTVDSYRVRRRKDPHLRYPPNLPVPRGAREVLRSL